jgi:hypothetical protein
MIVEIDEVAAAQDSVTATGTRASAWPSRLRHRA